MNAHIYTEKTVSAGTVTRTICLTVALANQLLSAMGKPILPIENSTIEQLVSAGFTIAAAIPGFWFNNSFTKAAQKADEDLKRYKNQL